MRDLHEMSIGHRVVLTVAIVIILLLLLAAFGYFTGRWDEAQGQPTGPQVYGDLPLDPVLIRLDKRALDTAYEQRLIKLWEVWLSPTTKDALSFTNGLRIARQRYTEAASAIAQRERQLIELEQRRQEQRK